MPYRAVVLHGVGCTIGIIEEVNGIGSPGHAHQLAAGVVVTACKSICHPLLRSQKGNGGNQKPDDYDQNQALHHRFNFLSGFSLCGILYQKAQR